MKERELQRIFRAAIACASAVACDANENVVVDAGEDATRADVTQPSDAAVDVGFANLDAPYVWCEAGAPTFVETCGGCCKIVDVPCSVPPDWYANEAGSLYHCDRICGDYPQNPWGCDVMTDANKPFDLGDAAFDDDAGVYVVCQCFGRRPAGYRSTSAPTNLGEYFANMARLEAASVFAFDRMRAELATMNAPRMLVERARRSSADEVRHTRAAARIAKRFGCAFAAPRAPRFRKRSMERFAIENAVEGCVRETYGALVATWQSMHARDERVRLAMRAIARDETRHAALAMSVASFASGELDEKSRARVERARRRAIRELRVAAAQSPHRDLVRVAGVPTREQAIALVDRLFASDHAA